MLAGVLLQDSRLFSGNVRQNLVLDDDNIDDRAISALLIQLNFTANHTFLEERCRWYVTFWRTKTTAVY
ncbi:hypothetical protein J4727_07995 [Providencia rettgeri]|uniref:Uncharacterized protein n=1 Tax=Providencia rettgeri TaxID=587 RepID=A0A939SR92_PRORE|nr:hypothetical protein [Providencia rettgeri]